MKARISKEQPHTQPKPEIISRDLFKQIKRYKHEEFSEFIVNLCAELSQPDYDKLRERLKEVKGIGEARLNDIMAVIEDYFTLKD